MYAGHRSSPVAQCFARDCAGAGEKTSAASGEVLQSPKVQRCSIGQDCLKAAKSDCRQGCTNPSGQQSPLLQHISRGALQSAHVEGASGEEITTRVVGACLDVGVCVGSGSVTDEHGVALGVVPGALGTGLHLDQAPVHIAGVAG